MSATVSGLPKTSFSQVIRDGIGATEMMRSGASRSAAARAAHSTA
jgi:hypothetical protein